jgi:HEAT repeat protein
MDPVPFTQVGAITEYAGLVRLDGDSLCIEYQRSRGGTVGEWVGVLSFLVPVTGLFKTGVQQVRVPVSDLTAVTLEGSLLSRTRIVLQAARMEAVRDVPGMVQGRIVLDIARKDREAAAALQELRDARARKRLVWMLDDTDATVRAAALDAYTKFEGTTQLDVAEAALRSSHEDIRVRGLNELVKLGAEGKGDAQAEALLGGAIEDEAAKVRGEAFRTLWAWHEKDPVKALDRALEARFPDLRTRAVTELATHAKERWAVERLERTISDRDANVARAAFDAVVKIHGEKDPAAYNLAMASTHASLRTAGAQGATHAAHDKVREALTKLLQDEDAGTRVAALEALCAKRSVRAVYVTPHHQYPSAVTLASARRLALLELAKRHRVCVIEDDYDHEFHYEGRPVLPLASADPDGVVAYVGTLSKLLAPGLRTGFVVGPVSLIEHLAARRSYVDRQGDHVTETALATLLEEGEVARHAGRARRAYQARRDAFVEALGEHVGERLRYEVPRGGMALWATIEGARGADGWIDRARDAGVYLQRTRGMCFDGRDRPALRLGFAGHEPEVLREAARRLGRCFKEA